MSSGLFRSILGSLGVAALLTGGPAQAHRRGFHKQVLVALYRDRLEALVTLAIDSGQRSQTLRGKADLNRNRKLEPDEIARLRASLADIAARPLDIRIGGFRLRFSPAGNDSEKIDLRQDTRVSDAGLTVAVLLAAAFPSDATEGMTIEISDDSPDHSHIEVEIFQQGETDGGTLEPARASIKPGEHFRVRLNRLIQKQPEP